MFSNVNWFATKTNGKIRLFGFVKGRAVEWVLSLSTVYYVLMGFVIIHLCLCRTLGTVSICTHVENTLEHMINWTFNLEFLTYVLCFDIF